MAHLEFRIIITIENTAVGILRTDHAATCIRKNWY
jgi:hypothetical protein